MRTDLTATEAIKLNKTEATKLSNVVEFKSEIQGIFNCLFREIFNILELALDDKKVEVAKDLAGNKLESGRYQCLNLVEVYFGSKSNLPNGKDSKL